MVSSFFSCDIKCEKITFCVDFKIKTPIIVGDDRNLKGYFMLIDFSVSNYLSFKDKVTLSMKRTTKRTHVGHLLKHGLLSGAVIYGANASGKTNLLQALAILAHNQVNITPASISFADSVNRNAFMHDAALSPEFEVNFFVNDIKYNYYCSFKSGKVEKEKLVYEDKNLIFERAGTNIEWGTEFQEERLLSKTANEQMLLLAKLRIDGVFNKDAKIKNREHLDNVVKFFEGIMYFSNKEVVRADKFYTFFNKDDAFKKYLKTLLNLADVGITDITWEKVNVLPFQATIPMVHGQITCFNHNTDLYCCDDKNGTLNFYKLKTKHGSEIFELETESAGTIKLIHLSLLLFICKSKEDHLLLIDEFDSLLHPVIVRYLLKGLLNSGNGQIITALHNTGLMDQDIWRVDEIWFTKKDIDHTSSLYPLTNFNPRFDKCIEKDYINGWYGAIPTTDESGWEVINAKK